MRRRSTFIHDVQLEIDPKQLVLSGNKFGIKDLNAAREERLTFGFNELPQELWQVLKQSHELHIRWSAPTLYNTTSPLVSRISPGLHVFYTPLKQPTVDLLCPLLHKVFSESLKCQSPNETFSSPPLVSSRFASTSSLQYYTLLSDLNNLVVYIQRKLCAHSDQSCIQATSLLNIVDSLDLDYDSISHALTLTAQWLKPPPIYYDPWTQFTTYNAWTLSIDGQKGDKVEVGVLSSGKATDPQELQLSGVLTVVGEDDHPKPTLFSFPSRHHSLPTTQQAAQAYTITFSQPTGLHPTMQISFPVASALFPPTSKPKESTCALHTYLTLPNSLFADKYQLSTTDSLFLASHNLVALRSISGETDLEAPDYVVKKWGSNLLLEVATPDVESKQRPQGSWNVTIPLHLRYRTPAAGGQAHVDVPFPVVFWACTADDGTKFPVNPFDRANLGYDGLFGSRTMFYHLIPNPGLPGSESKMLVETLMVPVLDTNIVSESWVEGGTVLTILFGFLWVVWKLRPGLMEALRELTGTGVQERNKKTKRQ
jgi:PIG-X / PBN1